MEDVNQLSQLLLFGEVNGMGIVPSEEEQVELKYLMVAMTAMRSSRKSTYATLLRFFGEGMVATLILWSRLF